MKYYLKSYLVRISNQNLNSNRNLKCSITTLLIYFAYKFIFSKLADFNGSPKIERTDCWKPSLTWTRPPARTIFFLKKTRNFVTMSSDSKFSWRTRRPSCSRCLSRSTRTKRSNSWRRTTESCATASSNRKILKSISKTSKRGFYFIFFPHVGWSETCY